MRSAKKRQCKQVRKKQGMCSQPCNLTHQQKATIIRLNTVAAERAGKRQPGERTGAGQSVNGITLLLMATTDAITPDACPLVLLLPFKFSLISSPCPFPGPNLYYLTVQGR
jgi:hypothetical protein